VFQYLQQHPGSPREQLPGVPVWHTRALEFSSAVWDAAHQSGVIALMPRDEIEDFNALHVFLRREFDLAYEAATATLDAQAYEFTDPDPTHLSPAQVTDEIRLLQTALRKLWLQGRLMQNLVTAFPDFPTTLTTAELDQVRNAPDEQTRHLLAPAESLTTERLKAAGYQPPANSK
jgi:hypothetical protein